MGELLVFELPLEVWVSGSIVILFIMLILYITALVQIGRLRRKLKAFVNGSNVPGLEAVITELHSKAEKIYHLGKNNEMAITELQKKTAALKGNLAVMRYNAFAEQGSDLSFSLTMLDDECNGVVISTIHSRDESLMYAKPIRNGTSSYVLTPEEKEVIHQAIQKKRP